MQSKKNTTEIEKWWPDPSAKSSYIATEHSHACSNFDDATYQDFNCPLQSSDNWRFELWFYTQWGPHNTQSIRHVKIGSETSMYQLRGTSSRPWRFKCHQTPLRFIREVIYHNRSSYMKTPWIDAYTHYARTVTFIARVIHAPDERNRIAS